MPRIGNKIISKWNQTSVILLSEGFYALLRKGVKCCPCCALSFLNKYAMCRYLKQEYSAIQKNYDPG